MFSAAEKTVKSAPAVQQKAASTSFFKKAGEDGFFNSKETTKSENNAFFNAPVQAKLKVSSPDDPQEKEADAVADKVMRMPEPAAEAKTIESSLGKQEDQLSRREEEVQARNELPVADARRSKDDATLTIQAKSFSTIHRGAEAGTFGESTSNTKSNPNKAESFEQSLAATKGGGSAMPDPTRQFMESRFNADFSNVRIHTDTKAVNLSRSVQAQAFAHGNDIYFNSNKYSPDSTTGRSLLAHELTHTIQQGTSKTKTTSPNSPEAINPKQETKARATNFKAQATSKSKSSEAKFPNHPDEAEILPKHTPEPGAVKTPSNTGILTKTQLSNWQVGAQGKLQSLAQTSKPHPASGPEVLKKEENKEDSGATESPIDIQKKQFACANPVPNPAGIIPIKVAGAASVLPRKAIKSPAADPAFQTVVSKVKKTAQQAKTHEPTSKKVKEAQSAAKPPANEKESLAKDKKVAEMAQQEPGVFDEAKFKAALREKIAALQLNTLKDAENFKANNGAAAVKGDVSSQVNNEKEKAAGSIEGKVKEAPAPGSVVGKQVGPEPAAASNVAAPAVNGAQAAPKPVPAEDVSLQKESQSLDKQMAEAKVSEKQLSKSNEPTFTGALADKKTAQKDAVQRPQQFRKDEKGIIATAQATATGVSKTQLNALVGTRKQKMGGVLSKQQEAKAKDEADRAKVAADIEQKFNATKTEVEGILAKLDTDVAAMFDKGISDATQDFEDYVDREVRKYKIERYLNRLGGSLLWAADLLLGMPDEVNDIYKRGKERYVRSMDVVINKVARLVVTQLNAAKKRIATGKAEIKSYVDKLPKNLQAIGNDAAKKVQAQFSELEQGVNNKQNELVDTLAAKYKAGLENVDKKIADMKEANKGLVDKAIGAIKEVIDAIIEFKNMLLNVLARAAAAIDLIIEDPIGFLGNLVAGVKQGIQNFVGNIATHLKNGLMGWLFGTLAEAGIQMPQSFDAKGIMSLILQVLGLTYANIRARAVNIVGEKVVAGLEKAAEIFIILKNEGIGGLWRFIKEKVEQLKDTVIESIKSFVIEKIVVAGVTWLISMLNPASAFIKACKMIYDVIMFFVTRGSQIMALVNAVIDSVTAIAKGAIGVAATAVENALAKALPVAISFLASLLGLGGISEKIKAIIAKIQAPINAAIDWVINKAVALVKGAGKLLGIGGDKNTGKDDKTSALQAAVKEVDDLMAVKNTNTAKVEAKLPAIKDKYKLTALDLIRDEEGQYHVKATINPTINGPSGRLFTEAELDELKKVAKEFVAHIKKKDKEKPKDKWIENYRKDPIAFIGKGTRVTTGKIVEGLAALTLEQAVAETRLMLIKNPILQLVDASNKPIGAPQHELDFLIVGESGVKEIVSAKTDETSEFRAKKDWRNFGHFKNMPLGPPEIVPYAKTHFGKDGNHDLTTGVNVLSSIPTMTLGNFRLSYLNKEVDKIVVKPITPGPEHPTVGYQLPFTKPVLIAKVVELMNEMF